MSIISQNNENEVAILDCVQRFFSSHKVGSVLKQCNGTKEKGVPAISLLRYKLSNVFTGRSMYMQQRTGSFKEGFSKNTFYRFLNSSKTNWLRFTSSLASEIINGDIKNLTDEKRVNVFIVDDTLFNRTSCKKTELGSRVFDHVGMKFRKGFRLLTIGWSDGNTFMPVNSLEYVQDLIEYGLIRYVIDNGNETGFKLWLNYRMDQVQLKLLKNPGNIMVGTYYYDDYVVIFASLKKDLEEADKLNYKDKFLQPDLFQWESMTNLPQSHLEKLMKSTFAHVFIRKMTTENGLVLPFTYVGKGKMSNPRKTDGDNGTYLFDIHMENELPEYLQYDFGLTKE